MNQSGAYSLEWYHKGYFLYALRYYRQKQKGRCDAADKRFMSSPTETTATTVMSFVRQPEQPRGCIIITYARAPSAVRHEFSTRNKYGSKMAVALWVVS